MGNIRLFFSKSLSANLTDKLDKSQSHYLTKVMRVKENEVFSLFNKEGEWEVKILGISKSIVEFKTLKQLRQKENHSQMYNYLSHVALSCGDDVVQSCDILRRVKRQFLTQ